jgi:hypothetical protein
LSSFVIVRFGVDNREYSICVAYNTISIRVAVGLVIIYIIIKRQSILWGLGDPLLSFAAPKRSRREWDFEGEYTK